MINIPARKAEGEGQKQNITAKLNTEADLDILFGEAAEKNRGDNRGKTTRRRHDTNFRKS